MAKKNKKNAETTPENNAENPVVNNENTEETPVTEESTDETNVSEEPATEEAPSVEEPAEEPAEVTVEEPAEVTVEEPATEEPVKEKSAQTTFEELIAKTPYAIYQNGVMICNSNPYLVIKTEAKYFEINFKKFSYQGIEVKHS